MLIGMKNLNSEKSGGRLSARSNAILLFVLTLFLLSFFVQVIHKPLAERIFSLTIRVTLENRNTQIVWNLTESDRAIGLFANNSWQEVYLTRTSHGVERTYRDSNGNLMAILDFSRRAIEPGGKLHFNFTYILIYRERMLPSVSENESGKIYDIPEELRRRYCQPTKLWQSNISVLMEKALEIAGDETNVLKIVKRFIMWITKEIRYRSSELPRYPIETFSSGEGDCDDQANLLITFCRAVGIPAYLQVGCIYIRGWSSSKSYYDGHLLFKQVEVGWHGWAMVFIPPWGWLPVDLTYVEGDLKSEPLKSITASAIVKHFTFQYMNITELDYAAEARALKSFLESHEFYIYEEDIMREETYDILHLSIRRPIMLPTLILRVFRQRSA